MKTLDQYPYDPNLSLQRVFDLHGLEKLRGVPAHCGRQFLFDLYHTLHNPKVQAESKRRHQEEEHEKRVDYATKAHAGKFGDDEQDLAIEVFGVAFPSVVPKQELGAFFRGLAALRHARANRVTGDE